MPNSHADSGPVSLCTVRDEKTGTSTCLIGRPAVIYVPDGPKIQSLVPIETKTPSNYSKWTVNTEGHLQYDGFFFHPMKTLSVSAGDSKLQYCPLNDFEMSSKAPTDTTNGYGFPKIKIISS